MHNNKACIASEKAEVFQADEKPLDSRNCIWQSLDFQGVILLIFVNSTLSVTSQTN